MRKGYNKVGWLSFAGKTCKAWKMRILRNKDRGQIWLSRRGFLRGCVAFAALSMVPTGLLRRVRPGSVRVLAYKRLRLLTNRDLYGPNPYAG